MHSPHSTPVFPSRWCTVHVEEFVGPQNKRSAEVQTVTHTQTALTS